MLKLNCIMGNIEALLNKLNEEQIKPVLDTEGAVLVIAGAGSGKTRVLTTRIAYLLEKKGVSPENIVAITFTNKAANEMKERLARMTDNSGGMWVSTIHSMCVRILRSDIEEIGYDRNFTIYDETDKDKVLKRVIEELGYDNDKMLKPAKNCISNAKNDCVYPSDFSSAYPDLHFCEEMENIYSLYEKTLARSNSLDFDDLLFKTYELFVKHPEVADFYADKFHYIHIDEFQDNNTVQFALAQRLAITHGNIFVVGDDDQSIYSWRGAKIENILNFDTLYPGAKVYKIERNYRSTEKILELANAIIANNKTRRDKVLWTDKKGGAAIETFIGADENEEASFCATRIKSLMARTDLKYKDFAVFMRVNAASRAFEQEFPKYGIPYKVYGGFRFFERKEIKDVLAYLKVVNNPKDDESFLRCIASPRRGIGEKTLAELREYCVGRGLSLYEGVSEIDNTTISGSAKIKLFNFKLLLDSFYAFSKQKTVKELIDFVLESTGFCDQFAEKSEDNRARLMNIDELKNTAELFLRDNPGTGLAEYLNSITLSSDIDDINNDDAVAVATIHAVKGLEYKCVFVCALEERILPVSFGTDEELEEERRLMYVAVTRAKERLYLTRARSRFMYGKRDYTTESRFFKEARAVINPTAARPTVKPVSGGDDYAFGGSLFEEESTGGYGYSGSYAKTMLSQSKPKEIKADTSVYRSGVKVKHPKFGEGVVVGVKGSGDNIIVDVLFKGVGMKSLAAKFAPMEII